MSIAGPDRSFWKEQLDVFARESLPGPGRTRGFRDGPRAVVHLRVWPATSRRLSKNSGCRDASRRATLWGAPYLPEDLQMLLGSGSGCMDSFYGPSVLEWVTDRAEVQGRARKAVFSSKVSSTIRPAVTPQLRPMNYADFDAVLMGGVGHYLMGETGRVLAATIAGIHESEYQAVARSGVGFGIWRLPYPGLFTSPSSGPSCTESSPGCMSSTTC